MISFFKGKPTGRFADVSNGMLAQPFFPTLRQEIDFTNTVTNYIKVSFEAKSLFTILGGCVFALQQDIKLASGFNLWAKTNLVLAMFEQRILLPAETRETDHSNLMKIGEILEGVANAWAEIAEEYGKRLRASPDHSDVEQLKAEQYLAMCCNRAAAIWLLTIMPPSKSGAAIVSAAATNVWLRLGMIPIDDLREWAETATGRYFRGTKCQQLAFGDWPSLLA